MQYFDQDYFEKNAILFADELRGIYIPQHFAQSLADDAQVIYDHDLDDWDTIKPILLEGPDHDLYWDSWHSTLDNAKIHHDGKVYSLWQDGDLWILPEQE
jgi:hypothetical protein